MRKIPDNLRRLPDKELREIAEALQAEHVRNFLTKELSIGYTHRIRDVKVQDK